MTNARFDLRQKSSRVRNQRGQALVETGLVVTILVILFLGIVEFGRMWMILNMVTHSLRDGARAAAVAPSTSRDPNGIILSGTANAIKTQVLNEIASVMTAAGNLNTPVIQQQVQNGIPTVTVTVSGNIPFAFGLFGATLPLNRSVTFRDEGR